MENHMNQENKLQASETVIANTISEALPLDANQADQAFNCGSLASKLNFSTVENVSNFARNVLGTNPTYEAWEYSRKQWIAGYCNQNPQNTGEAADKAWHGFANQLKALFGMDKPKSTSMAAEKKAEQREKKNAELLAKHQGASVGELTREIELAYQTLAKKPSDKETKKKVNELEKVIKVKQSAENKAQGEVLKELRTDAIELIKKTVSPEILEQVIEILESN
jgi:hypothetical protein